MQKIYDPTFFQTKKITKIEIEEKNRKTETNVNTTIQLKQFKK